MNILLINKSHFAKELRELGHHVFVLTPIECFNPNRFDSWSTNLSDAFFKTGATLKEIYSILPSNFSPDLIIYHDDSEPIFRVSGFEESDVLTVFYSVDAHIHYNWHPAMSGIFDAVFVAQLDYLNFYKQFLPNSFWLPLWTPVVPTLEVDRAIPVVFRGSLDSVRAKRVQFLEELSKFVKIDFAEGPAFEAYSKAKIVINDSISDDINFRVYEGLASGALLLTPKTGNGLDKLFTDGKHLITYTAHDVKDATDKISYYLANEAERLNIAKAGQELTLQAHTAKSRALEILTHLNTLTPVERPLAHFSRAFILTFKLLHWPDADIEQLKKNIFTALNEFELHAENNGRYFEEITIYLYKLMNILVSLNCFKEIINTLSVALNTWPEEHVIFLMLGKLYREDQQTENFINLAAKINLNAQEFSNIIDEQLSKMCVTGQLLVF